MTIATMTATAATILDHLGDRVSGATTQEVRREQVAINEPTLLAERVLKPF